MIRIQACRFGAVVSFLLVFVPESGLGAPDTRQTVRRPAAQPYIAPDLRPLLPGGDELRGPIERYEADLGSLRRYYAVPGSLAREQALSTFFNAWLAAL